MKTFYFTFIAAIIFMTGCATVPNKIIEKTAVKKPIEIKKTIFQQQYELLVFDVDGKPLDGAIIEYTIKDNGTVVESNTYTTTFDGCFRKVLNIEGSYSDFIYKVTKKGYYANSGSLFSLNTENKKDKIILIQPIDYFNKNFISKISDVNLKKKVLHFIDLIYMQGLVVDSMLETRSINFVPLKKKNYLQFRFINANVYNSMKLNKYDIGKTLFDEVIRKVLSPLNEHIGNSNLLYGYDITVVGYTKNFAEKYAITQPIEYRFMMPETVVRKYKNKDISGQQLLEASIILMDDERIDLKLQ